MKWFRFYSEAVNDPKVQRLSGDLFKFWINLLCLANNADERGSLPAYVDDIAWALRLSVDECKANLHTLQGQGLLDWQEDENQYKPHNWDERQKASDDVTARVTKYREKSNVSPETVLQNSETLQKRYSNALDKNRLREEEIREEKKRAPLKTARSFPEPFIITEDMKTWAKKNVPGLDILKATEEWADAMRSNTTKYKYTDWEAAWHNGMKRAQQWGGNDSNGSKANWKNGPDQQGGPRPLAFPKVARPGNALRRTLEDT